MTIEVQGEERYHRVRRYRISQHGLRMLMEEGASWRCAEGIPPGAKARGIQMDWDTQGVVLFIEHESFELRRECSIPEEGLVVFRAIERG